MSRNLNMCFVFSENSMGKDFWRAIADKLGA